MCEIIHCIKSWLFAVPFWYFCWKVVTFLTCQLKSLWHKNVENLFCSREFWFDLYCYVRFNFLIKCKLLFQYLLVEVVEGIWRRLTSLLWIIFIYCIMYSRFSCISLKFDVNLNIFFEYFPTFWLLFLLPLRFVFGNMKLTSCLNCWAKMSWEKS